MADAVASLLAGGRGDGSPRMVLLRDAHGIVQARSNPAVRAAEEEADIILPDGMPLVWLARMAGLEAERVYGPDLLLETCTATAGRGGARHVFLGGSPDAAERLQERLQKKFPDLCIAGVLTPDIAEPGQADPELCAAVNGFRPDIVWVVLGTPKQDLWMAANRPHLKASAIVGVGAAFDFISGRKPQAPRIVGRMGLEWVFRLITEPRRLGPRYASVIPAFLMLALRFLRTASANAPSRAAPPSSNTSA